MSLAMPAWRFTKGPIARKTGNNRLLNRAGMRDYSSCSIQAKFGSRSDDIGYDGLSCCLPGGNSTPAELSDGPGSQRVLSRQKQTVNSQ